MDNIDEFIYKISKGQDTSYDDINETVNEDTSGTQIVMEYGRERYWPYNYISENELPQHHFTTYLMDK